MKTHKSDNFFFRSLALGLLSSLITALPLKAAERVFFSYGAVNVSVSVADLDTFAKKGVVSPELSVFLGKMTPQKQAELREQLTKSYDINLTPLLRFFDTPMGQDVLRGLGNLISLEGGENGKDALREALEKASSKPEGLTLLNILEQFPGNVQFNTDKILSAGKLLNNTEKATKDIVKAMLDMSDKEIASASAVDFSSMADLRKPGPYGYEKQTITLTDKSRNRTFYVDIYKPKQWKTGKTPVVVASHGLASNPEHFAGRGKHLASYGYVVAVPQHPGSDLIYAKNVLNGTTKEVFDINEFVNRPRDISYVIDELQRRNNSEFGGRLNLKSVGAIGHSFGGYTVLALAGAQIDFDYLQKQCGVEFSRVNTSMLLQCRALNIPHRNYNFRDQRITAVIATNPVNSNIFGPKGLNKVSIPVMMGAGSYDPAAPVIFEQFRSFAWLNSPNKYLALAEGQAHIEVSELNGPVGSMIKSSSDLTFPSPDLLNNYINSMSLSFFDTYVGENERDRVYLQSAYANYLSQGEKFKLILITNSSISEVNNTIEQVRNKYFAEYIKGKDLK
ncbi:MAG: alpha/beta hydrolase [Microcoleaceae cyanobacterium]